MPRTPTGSSTPHYRYSAEVVLNSAGTGPAANVVVTFKDSAGNAITARDTTNLLPIATVTTSALGIIPDLYFPTDGSPVAASANGGASFDLQCAEPVTPGQFVAIQAQVAQAVSAAQTAASAAQAAAATSSAGASGIDSTARTAASDRKSVV